MTLPGQIILLLLLYYTNQILFLHSKFSWFPIIYADCSGLFSLQVPNSSPRILSKYVGLITFFYFVSIFFFFSFFLTFFIFILFSLFFLLLIPRVEKRLCWIQSLIPFYVGPFVLIYLLRISFLASFLRYTCWLCSACFSWCYWCTTCCKEVA